MADHFDIVEQAEEFVFELFKRKLPDHLVYHTYRHSKSVARTAAKIAAEMKLGEEGVEVVTLASLLHDTGYTELYKGHEEISIRIANEFLQSKSYSEEKIELIAGCIRATKVPQTPKNLLEEIVADADLSGLGKKSFFEQSELLRIEWERAQGKQYTDEEWAEQNIDLLSKHTFFTRAAQQRYSARQSKNLRRLYKSKSRHKAKNTVQIPTSAPQEHPVFAPAADVRLVHDFPESTFSMPTRTALRLLALADQRARFFLMLNLFLLLLAANHASRAGHPPLFAIPYIAFLPFFIISMFVSIRSLAYRFDPLELTSASANTGEDASAADLERVVRRKEGMNRWALWLFSVGILSALTVHIVVLLQHGDLPWL